mmetsp:Transcript_11785/g.32691  ORF Transcript_11785/g.32691 Transcript_11785/m.32691 type:complete len:204 (-) Transcript_11785:312-923(-)
MISKRDHSILSSLSTCVSSSLWPRGSSIESGCSCNARGSVLTEHLPARRKRAAGQLLSVEPFYEVRFQGEQMNSPLNTPPGNHFEKGWCWGTSLQAMPVSPGESVEEMFTATCVRDFHCDPSLTKVSPFASQVDGLLSLDMHVGQRERPSLEPMSLDGCFTDVAFSSCADPTHAKGEGSGAETFAWGLALQPFEAERWTASSA